MRYLLLAVLVACGPPVKSKPATAVRPLKGAMYCADGQLRYKGKVEKIHACTPSKSLCERGVRDAKGIKGRIAGVISVTKCRRIVE